jgi:MoaA/NifB/PqqE/SkfB family radical SAM enzyme
MSTMQLNTNTNLNKLKLNYIFLELTNFCNFQCAFCPIEKSTRKKGAMSYEFAVRMIDKIVSEHFSVDLRYIQLHLLGEPMLHPRIFDIIQYCEDKSITVYLMTNGSLLTPNNLKTIWDSNLTHLGISYMTPTEETFFCRGSINTNFEDYKNIVFNAIEDKILNNAKTAIHLLLFNTKTEDKDYISVISKNESAKIILEELLAFSEKLKQKYHINFEHYYFSGKDEINNLLDGAEEMIEILPGISIVFKKICQWGNFRHIPLDQLVIYWNGDTSLTCLDYDNCLDTGNLTEMSIRDIWYSEKAIEIRNEWK